MRVTLRIVAGSLKGRRLNFDIGPQTRPTPQMVREALFSILGNAVPGRPFYDVFAGTGIVGLEALSRDASQATFVERDVPSAQAIDRYLSAFHLRDKSRALRIDSYRWAAGWQAPAEPVNVFVSPPFADFERRHEDLLGLLATLQSKVAPGSVLVVQSEKHNLFDELPELETWEQRRYGRNVLLLWVKE
jgi:16S rRNA (guanine(966)-N(2))-methyltransferase RsmD